MAGAAGPDVDRRRYGAHQRHAEPRPEAVQSGAPDCAGGERYFSAGESEARRARHAARVRVRADRRAAEAGGRHRFDGSADRPSIGVFRPTSRRTFRSAYFLFRPQLSFAAASIRFAVSVFSHDVSMMCSNGALTSFTGCAFHVLVSTLGSLAVTLISSVSASTRRYLSLIHIS